MKKITTLLAVLLIAVSQGAYAQRTITGKVINAEDGLAMPGVSVVVKGTTTGMSTTSDGNFILNVPNDATVVVSFVGFKTVEIPAGTQTRLEIMLEPDAHALGEVVVKASAPVRVIPPEKAVITALGIVRDKNTLTTSIQTISGDELRRGGDQNFMTALVGIEPGIQVLSNGQRTVMTTIRGIKSFYNGAQSPLFVIDGVPFAPPRTAGEGEMYVDITDIVDMINIENIENITVLRSANAAVLYGSQGVNGVVIITTKKTEVAKVEN